MSMEKLGRDVLGHEWVEKGGVVYCRQCGMDVEWPGAHQKCSLALSKSATSPQPRKRRLTEKDLRRQERDKAICSGYDAGMSREELAATHGITSERVRQILVREGRL